MEENANVVRDIDILTGQPMLGDVEGEPLFVINLCAAMTPQNLDGKALPGLEQYKLYQVSRIEDGRRRYRLRLGFFTSETDAEDVLASVRQQFATAFTACLCDEDLKHASGYLKRSIQDLQRTGRFKIKARPASAHDPMTSAAATSDTAIVRVLKPAATIPHAAGNSSARTTPTAKPAPSRVPPSQHAAEVELTWAPERSSTHTKATAPQVSAPSAPARPVQPSASFTQTGMHAASNTGSLMRRAHALEALATARGDRQMMATGKFPAQPPVQPSSSATPAARTASVAAKPHVAAIAPPEAGATAAKPRPTQSPTPAAAPPSARATMATSSATHSTRPIASTGPTTAPTSAVDRNIAAAAALKLEATTPPLATKPVPASPRNEQPFHVGNGVDIPETHLSLDSADRAPVSIHEAIASFDPPTNKQTIATAAATIAPVLGTGGANAEASHMADLMHARELAKQSSAWRQQHSDVPTLDTTQTIRTLTKKEIEDDTGEKWYIVQLALSEHPVNLDTMPRLDIFEAYNLYSVATMVGDHIRHALRLGFFREEVSAQAVLGYLKTFFNEPTIERIADAEHNRFANSKATMAPRPENTPKPSGTVVDLEEKRPKHVGVVPTINSSVERPAARVPSSNAGAKPMQRSATPATKVAAPGAYATGRKSSTKAKSGTRPTQADMLKEARALGLSDTAILRVQKNPSLLSRLVGKLTK